MVSKDARGASETASTEQAKEVVTRLWERMQDRDWAGLGALLSPEAVVDWPVSRERIHGRENYVAVQSEYPQGWSINVLRVVGGGEEAASEVEVPLEGVGVFRVASFWRLSQGLIVSGTEYWSGPEYDPSPAWRAPFVERY